MGNTLHGVRNWDVGRLHTCHPSRGMQYTPQGWVFPVLLVCKGQLVSTCCFNQRWRPASSHSMPSMRVLSCSVQDLHLQHTCSTKLSLCLMCFPFTTSCCMIVRPIRQSKRAQVLLCLCRRLMAGTSRPPAHNRWPRLPMMLRSASSGRPCGRQRCSIRCSLSTERENHMTVQARSQHGNQCCRGWQCPRSADPCRIVLSIPQETTCLASWCGLRGVFVTSLARHVRITHASKCTLPSSWHL